MKKIIFATLGLLFGSLVNPSDLNTPKYLEQKVSFVNTGAKNIEKIVLELCGPPSPNVCIAKSVAEYAEKILEKEKAGQYEYYGRHLVESDFDSVRAQTRKYDKQGLKRMDCITFCTYALYEATGSRFWKDIDTGPKMAEILKDCYDWTTIFVCCSPDSAILYNNKKDNSKFTAEKVRNSNGKNYFAKIDYYVAGSEVSSPEFLKQINQMNGFVVLNEGGHCGIISGGEWIQAHWKEHPGEVFESIGLIYAINNPKGYPTALLIVPKEEFHGKEKWKFDRTK